MKVRGQEPVKFLTKHKFTFGISLLISQVRSLGGVFWSSPPTRYKCWTRDDIYSSLVQGIGWNELTTDRKVEQEAAKKEQPYIIKTAKGTVLGKGEETEASKIVGRYPAQGQCIIRTNSPFAVFSPING